MLRFLKLFALFLILLSGCSNKKEKEINSNFKKLYSSLIQELTQSNIKLEKHFIHNGKYDKIIIHEDSVDFSKELKVFTDLVILNKMYSEYEIRSLNGGCEKYFQTLNDKHTVKNMYYSTCKGYLVVYIDVNKSSPLFNFDYHLELNKNGYLIEIKSNVELTYRSIYRIEGRFILE